MEAFILQFIFYQYKIVMYTFTAYTIFNINLEI